MAMDSITDYIAYLNKIHGRTRRVVEAMPRVHWEYAYREGRFTFGDLVRHIGATKRYLFTENICGRASCYAGHGPEIAAGRTPLEFLDAMHAESVGLLQGLTPEQLGGECTTVAGVQLPVRKLLELMAEHEVHHRGQLYIYLAMLDIPAPPLFGLTEPEVKRRSISTQSS
jgi:uncharacterized damage-inducible protein DinB